MAFRCVFQEQEGGPQEQAHLNTVIEIVAATVKFRSQVKYRNMPSNSDGHVSLKSDPRDLCQQYLNADQINNTDQMAKETKNKGKKTTETNKKGKRNVDDEGEIGQKKKSRRRSVRIMYPNSGFLA